MRYCVFFVPRDGVHPCASLDLYRKLWPIMHESVARLGHRLTHITDLQTECWGDDVFRIDLDPSTTIYSRDIAWLAFLQSMPDGEQACMIEPDTYMLREVPPIGDRHDLVVLRRPISRVPGWFRLATNRAVPFYREVVRQYDRMDESMRVFHGDILAIHRTLGIADDAKADVFPSMVHGCRIEVRDWVLYGFRKTRGQYFLQFKGTSKEQMLALAGRI